MRRRDDMQPPRRYSDPPGSNYGPDYGRGSPRQYHEYDERRPDAYARRQASSNAMQRRYRPPEMFERDVERRQPYGSGPGRSNYGASKYGGSEYANVDYDRTPAERSNYGGPYSLQADDEDYGWSREATDSWIPENENENRVNYDPGSWVNSPKAPKGRRPLSGQSDERIRQWVCERLSDAPALDDREIYVDVRNRNVTLTGYVRSRSEKYLAEEVAESVGGVLGINNCLEMRSF